MNKKELVQKKIRELNPELMELSFGCEIEKDGEIYSLAVAEDKGVFEKTLEGYWMCVNKEGQAVSLEKGVREIIIGHPIQPHHILIALGDKVTKTVWQAHNERFALSTKDRGVFYLDKNGAPLNEADLEVLYELLEVKE